MTELPLPAGRPSRGPSPRPNLEADLLAGTAFPFGDETYRRRISIRPRHGGPDGADRVDAEMEDYVHHFAITVDHLDGVVVGASAEGVRHPWDACPGGANGIRELVGTRLDEAAGRQGWSADKVAQCVHVVDLAELACAHAGDDEDLVFEVLIPRAAHHRRTVTLRRNGVEAMAWTLKNNDVVAPDRFVGLTISGGAFFRWIDANLPDPDEREAATIMRRAAHIGTSRGMDLDRYAVAADGGAVTESCFVFRSGVADRARRIVGSARATEADLETDLDTDLEVEVELGR